MPRGAIWGAWSSAVQLWGAATMECCCHGWTCQGPTTNRGGSQQCSTQQHDNCHSDSHYHLSATSSLATTVKPPCDIAAAINQHLLGALEQLQCAPCCPNPWLPVQYAEEGATISGLEGSTPKWSSRIPSDWMRRTQPYQPWWQALHRCLHRQSCQKISPALLMSVTHHPHQPWQKHWRWIVPSQSHSLRFPSGLGQPACQRRCFGCKGKWTWP